MYKIQSARCQDGGVGSKLETHRPYSDLNPVGPSVCPRSSVPGRPLKSRGSSVPSLLRTGNASPATPVYPSRNPAKMPSALLQVSLWSDLLAWLPLAAVYDDDGFEALVKIKLDIFQENIRSIEEKCGGNDADIANGIQACIDKYLRSSPLRLKPESHRVTRIKGALADGSPAYWPSRAARRMQIQIWIVEGDGL